MTKFLKESFKNGNRYTNIALSILIPIIIAGVLWLGGKIDRIYTLSIEHEMRIKSIEENCSENKLDIKELQKDFNHLNSKQ